MHGSTLPVWIIILIASFVILFVAGFFGTYVPKRAKERFREGGSKQLVAKTMNPFLVIFTLSILAMSDCIAYLIDFFTMFNYDDAGWLAVLVIILTILAVMVVTIVLCMVLLLFYIASSAMRCALIKCRYKRQYGLDVEIIAST